MGYWAQLTAVLEEEIAVGRELERNLAAQKKALITWDVEGLLQQIAEREPWVRSLSALESKRADILGEIRSSHDFVTLRQLIAAFPQDAAESARLRLLRQRAHEIFTRLHHDESALHGLMETLLAHVQEALQPLLGADPRLYSESGTPEPTRVPSALIRSKV